MFWIDKSSSGVGGGSDTFQGNTELIQEKGGTLIWSKLVFASNCCPYLKFLNSSTQEFNVPKVKINLPPSSIHGIL